MSAMLDVSNALKYPGQVYPFELGVEIEEMEVLSDPVAFTDVSVRGEFFGSGEQVSIRGEITSTVTSRCAKCLEPVVLKLNAEMDAQYARQIDPRTRICIPLKDQRRISRTPFGTRCCWNCPTAFCAARTARASARAAASI